MSNQLPVSDGNFAAWPKHDAPEIEYPFPGDTAHFTVRQRYRGDLANYAAPNISGATHDVLTSAYCTGDLSVSSVGGGVFEADREFSTIPNSRVEAEFYPFGFPALAGGTLGNAVAVGSIAGADSNTNVLITTNTNHGFTTANFLGFNWLASVTLNGGVSFYQYGLITGFPLATTANTAKFPNRTSYGHLPTGSFTASNFRELSPGRQARTIVVPAYVQYDYFMPGVSANIASTDDIQLIQEDTFYDQNANTATEINANTTPSLSEWRTRMSEDRYFVGTASIIRRYKGNIFERATRYVKYA